MNSMRRTAHISLIRVLSLLLCLSLVGCSGFYSQAFRGQMEILTKRKGIDRVIADPDTSDERRQKLTLIQEIRRFADAELKLDVGGNYGSFVDLEREHVVWNVMAAPELSLKPKTWCYPIAGCVGYRGFFNENDALRLVAELESQGYDVLMGGVDAYSTLGYLRDPVLNTFLKRGDVSMASLLFHELAHAKFYLKGDTAFNEGYATAVEYAGLKAWLESKGERFNMDKFRDFDEATDKFRALVTKSRQQLAGIYASKASDAQKRAWKKQEISALRDRYYKLKPELNGISYDKWFEEEINNAKLNSISTYEDYVPAFTELLDLCKRDFDCFYARVERIAELDRTKRAAALKRLGKMAEERLKAG